MPAKIFGDLSLESPTSPDGSTPTGPGFASELHASPSSSSSSHTALHHVNTEPVVVSGMSGRLPESDSLDEFRDNLMAGVDMVTEDGRRWTPGSLKFLFLFFFFCVNVLVKVDRQDLKDV